MSLVGNLEDLSLGDIMQIISLSQKSGVLALDGEAGSGRIVFLNGLVHAASVKGGLEDLRSVLVGKGLLDGAVYDQLASVADDRGLTIEEAISGEGHLTAQQIQDVIQEAIESTILDMFAWPSGDFSFDVRSELEPSDPQLLLASGINAQYLAMEGMRLSDERKRDEGEGADGASTPSAVEPEQELTSEVLFGTDPLATQPIVLGEDAGEIVEVVTLEADDEVRAADVLVASVVAREDDVSTSDPLEAVAAEMNRERSVPAASAAEADRERSAPAAVTVDAAREPMAPERGAADPAPPEQAPPRPSAGRSMPVVLIDPDVTVLEWVKEAIQGDFARVHVFQQAEPGLTRIRQYLIRGEAPLVLLSTQVRIDPLSGIHGLADFVARLKTQSRKLIVVGLHEGQDGSAPPRSIAFDGVLPRPDRVQLRDRPEEDGAKSTVRALADRLQEVLVARAATAIPSGRSSSGSKAGAGLRALRDTTSRLQEASSRGEILPVVLDFASEIFARVAILVVRSDQVFAIAGRGIETLEVKDPLGATSPVSMQSLDSGWIRKVIESGKPAQGAPSTAADRELLARLGGIEPDEVYVGPIESGGTTIALLYGDQGKGGAEMPDTSGLEVVLQHAGLALERAALERALWEADGGTR